MREGGDVLVELETNDAGGAIVTGASGEVFFLNAAESESELAESVEVSRKMEARIELGASEVREGIVLEEAVAVAEEVRKHLRPADPEDQADQCEEAGEEEENAASATLIQANPEKGNQESIPRDGGDETADHGVEGREGKAFTSPMVVTEPGLTRLGGGFVVVFRFTRGATQSVDDEESPGEKEE